MIKRRWPRDLKEKARQLRIAGRSYTEITRELSVARSTLHFWVHGIPRPAIYVGEARKTWLAEMRKLAREANKRKYQRINDNLSSKVRTEVESVTLGVDHKKAILGMLYWAEGSKGEKSIVVFANTDPRLCLLFVTLLRECYNLDESKFRIRLHLHHYHKEVVVKKFWSELLKVPLDQFGKTYRKKRSKEKTFRRNFGGICFLKYNSLYLQREITQFAIAIGEKISGKVTVPVA